MWVSDGSFFAENYCDYDLGMYPGTNAISTSYAHRSDHVVP